VYIQTRYYRNEQCSTAGNRIASRLLPTLKPSVSVSFNLTQHFTHVQSYSSAILNTSSSASCCRIGRLCHRSPILSSNESFPFLFHNDANDAWGERESPFKESMKIYQYAVTTIAFHACNARVEYIEAVTLCVFATNSCIIPKDTETRDYRYPDTRLRLTRSNACLSSGRHCRDYPD
jgi:hypothetical protein